jgi:hypothetical protein
MSVGQSLLFTFIIDFGIQFIFYVPAAIFKTEKFYGKLRQAAAEKLTPQKTSPAHSRISLVF